MIGVVISALSYYPDFIAFSEVLYVEAFRSAENLAAAKQPERV